MSISALWAKKSKEGAYWLGLDIHLKDTAEVAKRLWRKWLPENVKQTVAKSIGGDEQEAEKLVLFLAAAHDIGKATPVFQAKGPFQATDLDEELHNRLLANGFNVKESRQEYAFSGKTPHALASQLLLENAKDWGLSDANLCTNAAVILGAHHGKPPDDGYTEIASYKANFGRAVEAWMRAQSALIGLALECGGYKSLAEVPCPTMPGQVLLSGLLIMADWIASDTDKFELVSVHCPSKIPSSKRAQSGFERLKLPNKWQPVMAHSHEGLYAERFEHINEPNEMQKAALRAAVGLGKPGIMVIEAPMGLGKTEAALVVAEVFRDKTESGGIFFALPTQATSDGIFPRLEKWMQNLDVEVGEKHSINLVHGKAQFNKDFLKLFEGKADVSGSDDEERIAFVHQWFNGRKKAMLADFIAGTVDQLLLMALKQKHVMLRHLGLAGKIVIIDECHAYDAYMSQYLKRALEWLGAYGVPVLVLSATLPVDTRREVIGAYLGKKKIDGAWAESRAYPLITYTDGGEVKCHVVEAEGKHCAVQVERLTKEAVADKLEDLLSAGGCAGVIMDTVQRAQDMARTLRERFGADTVRLIHSRFIATDRLEREEELREALGRKGTRPDKRIVVGTQVLEQSLDIDFDVMVTDIAPMDLLLQRMGRLHRHERSRPKKLQAPLCFITGLDGDDFEKGIDSVYDKHLLMRTRDLLDNLGGTVSLPKDIARLVNDAYDKNAEATVEKHAWEAKTAEKSSRAKTFCMKAPNSNPRTSLIHWLSTDVHDDPTGKKGEAAVRDTDESIEVLIVKEKANQFSFINETPPPSCDLPSGNLPVDGLSDKLARAIATQALRLPRALCHPYIIDRVIQELETRTREHVAAWLKSPWLSGELFLIMDKNNATSLCGYKISYTKEEGLICIKENAAEGEK